MTLEAKCFRHIAVTIPVSAVDGFLTASPRQESVAAAAASLTGILTQKKTGQSL
jgi:hypothetical protein